MFGSGDEGSGTQSNWKHTKALTSSLVPTISVSWCLLTLKHLTREPFDMIFFGTVELCMVAVKHAAVKRDNLEVQYYLRIGFRQRLTFATTDLIQQCWLPQLVLKEACISRSSEMIPFNFFKR